MPLDLFDTVGLQEDIDRGEGAHAPTGTLSSVVEGLNLGEAYLVECFGGWVKSDEKGNFESVDRDHPEAFVDTGVEIAYPHSLQLVQPAAESVGVRAQLLMLIEGMPEVLLEEIKDCAELIHQRNLRLTQPSKINGTLQTPSFSTVNPDKGCVRHWGLTQ